VTFRYKDYRVEGRDRQKAMTLAADEFIRRFLTHVLPRGFHRIRHYGLFANTRRAGRVRLAPPFADFDVGPEVAATFVRLRWPNPSVFAICERAAAYAVATIG